MIVTKKILLTTSIVGFLFALISFVTPGWMAFYMDILKMTEIQLQKAPLEVQNQYKAQQAWQKQNNVPSMTNIDITAAPFYIRYCVRMEIAGTATPVCVMLSTTDLLSLLDAFTTNATKDNSGQLNQAIQMMQKNGITISYLSHVILAIVVISSLTLVQSLTSLILTVTYTCKKFPRKKLGVVGGISLIVSGSVCFVIVMVYLISYRNYTSQIPDEMTDALKSGFPYSTILCICGSLMFFISAFILIRITMKSKEQFNYEMMVIDTSRGGSTYVAKT